MKFVKILDHNTDKITEIPEMELAPGMIQVQLQEAGEVVWADPSAFKQNQEYLHPPFDDETKAVIAKIQSAVEEVFPMSVERWEDGFRRDEHPEREIVIWLRAAMLYQDMLENRDFSLDERKDIFRVFTVCMNSSQEQVREVLDIKCISKELAEEIIENYYGEGE